MSNPHVPAGEDSSRRDFLKQATLGLAGAAALPAVLPASARATPADMEVRIGVVGCGGRGTGAVLDALGAATKVIYPQEGYHTEDVTDASRIQHKNITVVALADLFDDRLQRAKGQLAKIGIDVPAERCFTGIDAYQSLLAIKEINYVILATPPHFRPAHLTAAVEAGKHVFIEKPVAVDAPGVRMIMAAGDLARTRGLGIAAGTQRRHDRGYQETIKRIHDGAIGDIVYAKCYWNGGQIWVIDREAGWSDLEWQFRNWNYFTWLGGDHIVEQHVHNLDVMNWALKAHPVKAVSALGGRQVRIGDRHGHIFDHFAVEFEYPNGVSVFSQSRQINGCQNLVGEHLVGTLGTSNCASRIDPKQGEKWRYRAESPSAYRLTHEDLISSIAAGAPINEAQAIAESTMTGIMGREAAYSGQAVTWEQAMKSETRLGPPAYDMTQAFAIPAVAMPGQYRFE
jgi:predicted dehydrogenase